MFWGGKKPMFPPPLRTQNPDFVQMCVKRIHNIKSLDSEKLVQFGKNVFLSAHDKSLTIHPFENQKVAKNGKNDEKT